MSYLACLALTLGALHAVAVPSTRPEPRVAWQRSLADAEALARISGKPLLVCVNMDGEVACETFANRKYRNTEFVELTRGFVPVIASPVRHTQADHDERGERIPCPRFGRVTCGEHLRIEAPVYERFFDGKRYAPRHVGVRFSANSGEGEVLFDRFLDSDLRRVDDALRAHGVSAQLALAEDPLERRDAGGRAALEADYLASGIEGRRELLTGCLHADVIQGEVIRLGLHEQDPELRRLAAAALAAARDVPDVDLVVLALAQEEDLQRRDQLGALLADRAQADPRTQRELKVNNALRARPRVDAPLWLTVFEDADDPQVALEDRAVLEARLGELLQSGAAEAPQDALGVARCYLGLARWGLAEGSGPGYFLQDADVNAERAAGLGADAAQVAAVRSQIAWLEFRQEEAGDLAEAALTGLADDSLDADPDGREAFAVLSVLAASRTRSILAAGTDWDEAWATEALAAYRAIEAHPASTPAQWAAHVDLLDHLNLKSQRDRVLEQALERFPVATEMHERLRSVIAEERGIGALEEAYAERRSTAPDLAGHDWFSGYATLVVAEDHRRGQRWDEAQEAYERAKDYFARSAQTNSEYEPSCLHFQAMALAGQAQAALKDGQLETAVVRISDAVCLRPESLETQDGLERTPLDVLTDVVAAVREPSRADLMARLARLEITAPDVWQRVN